MYINTKSDSENIQRGDSVLAAKAGFWYVCGSFVGKAITFITTPIFARLMSPSDYGEFSNFASWAALLLLVVGAELFNTLNRAFYDFKEHYDEYVSSLTVLAGMITIAVYVLFLLCHSCVFKVVKIPERYVHLLFIFLLFSVCRQIFFARERTLYRYKTVAFITFLSLFVPTIISVSLVYFLPESSRLSARLYGFYAPSAVIGMFCAAALFKKGIAFKGRYCRYALILSIPLLVHYLTAYLLTSTNIMIVKNMVGTEAAALVSIAHSTIHILTVFFQATSGALTTWVMDNLEFGENNKVRKGTFYYSLLLAIIITGTILFSPELIQILGGKKYVFSVQLLPGLVFATFIQSITTIFTIILTYDKNVVKAAVYTGTFALVSILAKIWLLPTYGLISLVYVNIAVFIALFLINYILVRKAGYADSVSFKGIAAIIFLTGFLAAVSQLLFTRPALRYTLIVIFMIGCIVEIWLNKDRIAASVKIIRNARAKKKL